MHYFQSDFSDFSMWFDLMLNHIEIVYIFWLIDSREKSFYFSFLFFTIVNPMFASLKFNFMYRQLLSKVFTVNFVQSFQILCTLSLGWAQLSWAHVEKCLNINYSSNIQWRFFNNYFLLYQNFFQKIDFSTRLPEKNEKNSWEKNCRQNFFFFSRRLI